MGRTFKSRLWLRMSIVGTPGSAEEEDITSEIASEVASEIASEPRMTRLSSPSSLPTRYSQKRQRIDDKDDDYYDGYDYDDSAVNNLGPNNQFYPVNTHERSPNLEVDNDGAVELERDDKGDIDDADPTVSLRSCDSFVQQTGLIN